VDITVEIEQRLGREEEAGKLAVVRSARILSGSSGLAGRLRAFLGGSKVTSKKSPGKEARLGVDGFLSEV